MINIKLEQTGKKYLPKKILPHAQPLLRKADAILLDDSEDAASQRSALLTFVIRVASAFIALLSQILLARWLGTFEYGIFVGIWVALIILSTITCLGFPSAVVRFIGEYREKNRPDMVHGIIRASMFIALLFSILTAGLGSFILYTFPNIVSDAYVVPIFLAAICLPMLAIEGILDYIARAFDWPKTAFLPTYIIRPLAIIFFVALTYVAGYIPTAITTMYAAIGACLVSFLAQYIVILGKLRKALPKVAPTYKWKYWTLVALPIFLVEGFYTLMTSMDVLIVSYLMKPEDTAVYFAATKILALVHFVYFAVRAAVSHRYSALHSSGDKKAFQAFVTNTVAWTFWPSLFMALFMAIFGHLFLMLFGEEFTAGTFVLYFLLIGIVIRSSIGPAEALLVMAGSQNVCAVIYIITLFVNVTLNFTLIPKFGIIGAAMATSIALIFETSILYVSIKRSLGLHVFIIPKNETSKETLV